MKKLLSFAFVMLSMLTASAQYNVGTSTTTTNAWGQQVTTHKNAYGKTTGTSTTGTNAWGQSVTTHKDAYGRTVGTSTTGTNAWGQQ